jgi:short-chain fatty acids transporter
MTRSEQCLILTEISLGTTSLRITGRGRTAADLGIELETDTRPVTRALMCGAWLEHSPILTWLVVALGTAYLVRYLAATDDRPNALNLNSLNLTFCSSGSSCTARRRGSCTRFGPPRRQCRV